MNITRVNRRFPCPVCGKTDYCGVAEDRSFAICMRIKADKQTRNGGYIHKLGYDLPTKIVSSFPYSQNDRHPVSVTGRSVDEKHSAYSKLLNSLPLYPVHLDNLQRRGLSDALIKENQYRSIPPDNKTELTDLEGVPGFYFQDGWRMAFRGQGIIIPVRDEWGRIQALQIRHDESLPRYVWFSSPYKPKGISSGAPVHFQKIYAIENHAYITEGALKADIISYCLNAPVIGIAGVSTFQEGFGKELRERISGLTQATVCFDSDFRTKPQVQGALSRLIRELERGGLKVRVRTWTPKWKGYDDFLVRTA